MHGGFHRSNMKRRCRWREATPISRDFANCFDSKQARKISEIAGCF